MANIFETYANAGKQLYGELIPSLFNTGMTNFKKSFSPTVYPSDSTGILNTLGTAYALDAYSVDNANKLQRQYLDSVMNYNSAEASMNRAFQSSEAQKNRLFQEQMSNSAYQRAYNDLKQTGLNPYLILSKGMSASVPSGSVPSGSSSSVSVPSSNVQKEIVSTFGNIYNNLVNTAFQNKKLSVDVISDFVKGATQLLGFIS